jgi:hypothetical protein
MLAAGGNPDKRGVKSAVISAFLAFPEFIAYSDMDDISRDGHDALSCGKQEKGVPSRVRVIVKSTTSGSG